MTLNEGQQAAEKAVFQFLLSDAKEFCLTGGPGRGKTFMMKHTMDTTMDSYMNGMQLLGLKPTISEMFVTATTNKAAEVLEKTTGYPCTTIHSFLKIKVKNNFHNGTTSCEKLSSFKIRSNIILFIDEASMIDSSLMAFIHEACDHTCKIIYIGDKDQMAPITENLSPVYAQPKNLVELTQPVRNADKPALIALCDQLKLTVQTGVFKPIVEVPGVIDFIDDAQLQKILDRDFISENVDSRVLCYTNARTNLYNEYIREIRGYPDRFSEGEILINGSNYSNASFQMKIEQSFVVNKVCPETFTVHLDPFNDACSMECYKITVSLAGITHADTADILIPVDPKRKKDLMSYFKSHRKWQRFFELQNEYPDLRAKEASTVWKAQGSTYASVIVDLTNISTSRDNDQVARMLYVSASRPKNRIYFYGELGSRFFI